MIKVFERTFTETANLRNLNPFNLLKGGSRMKRFFFTHDERTVRSERLHIQAINKAANESRHAQR